MPKRKRLYTLFAVLLAVVFAAGLVRLAGFASATDYPAYSSLHSGPEGTKLLFEALAATGKVEMIRDYLPAGEATLRNAAVFYLGITPDALVNSQNGFFAGLEGVAKTGNRLILGITDQKLKMGQRSGAIEKRWGIRVTKEAGIVPVDAHAWRALADTGGFERSFGAGTIVLLPQVGRLSNENLARNPSSRALAASLLGTRKRVVFEEAHLGVVETGSIAGLARHYHLQGLAAGLLLVAVLFVWNRSWVFPPPSRYQAEDSTVMASDSRLTLVGLMSRHIRPESLIDICVAQWNQTRPCGQPKALLQAGQHDALVNTYRKIQEQIQCKKTINS
jgi:hypothetical protein